MDLEFSMQILMDEANLEIPFNLGYQGRRGRLVE